TCRGWPRSSRRRRRSHNGRAVPAHETRRPCSWRTSMNQPSLTTQRLLLRPLHPDDAADVQRLAGHRAIADTTLSIPHPYLDGMAEEWIRSGAVAWEKGRAAAFAITENGELRGVVTMALDPRSRCGELGYWIGEPYWGRGLASEAVRAVLEFGFGELG